MSTFQNNADNAIPGYSQIPPTASPVRKVKRLMTYHVGNLQGVGARARQEDSFTFANVFDVREMREKGMLFVVCDGMGGMKDGKIASETAISTIRNDFLNMNRNGDIAVQLKNSVYKASNEVEAILGGEGGSTVIACIIYNDKLYYACVGDSFLYLKRNGLLYRLNLEHNMCNQVFLECIREGKIDPSEGRNDPEAVALTQFLGMTGLEEVDGSVRPLPIKEGDILLACSDGVGGVLSEQEVLGALSYQDPQFMCEQLERGIIAHAKKNQDNYTAIVVKCFI